MKITKIMTVATVILVSCSTPQKTIPLEQKDSTSTNVKETVIYRDSIIYVPVPPAEASSSHPAADTSHLETSLAESTAYVDSTGNLHHDLRHKADAMIPAAVKLPQSFVETNKVQWQLRTVERLIEREFTDWERFLMMMGKISLTAAAIALLIFAARRRL